VCDVKKKKEEEEGKSSQLNGKKKSGMEKADRNLLKVQNVEYNRKS